MAFDRLIAGVAALLLLAACREDVDLLVVQDPAGKLELHIKETDGSGRRCIDQASIYAMTDHIGPPIWETGRSRPDICLHAVRVGTPAAGFSQRMAMPQLPDAAYCAEVLGPGYGASRRFSLLGGRLQSDGSANDCGSR